MIAAALNDLSGKRIVETQGGAFIKYKGGRTAQDSTGVEKCYI
jgi:hypothetical protein